jgi:hypothetical protein
MDYLYKTVDVAAQLFDCPQPRLALRAFFFEQRL